jgi:hypothetical protein
MTVLFIPRRIQYNGLVIGIGAALTTQATYTVPAGKRAELYHCFGLILANGATVGTGMNRVIVAAIAVPLQTLNIAPASGNAAFVGTLIDLIAGETVILQTQGGAVAAITMSGAAFIREYQ